MECHGKVIFRQNADVVGSFSDGICRGRTIDSFFAHAGTFKLAVYRAVDIFSLFLFYIPLSSVSVWRFEPNLPACPGARTSSRGLGYPSREKNIQTLSIETINKATIECAKVNATKIHFVSHSMGGILVRYYLEVCELQNLLHCKR